MPPSTRSKVKEEQKKDVNASICDEDHHSTSSLGGTSSNNEEDTTSSDKPSLESSDDGNSSSDEEESETTSSNKPSKDKAKVSGKLTTGKLKGMKIQAVYFQDNQLTEGGKVKASRKVLSTYYDHCEKAPIVNCRVQTFARIVTSFNERKKKWVKEMGFENLLLIPDIRLPRDLCYWLMTGIDPIGKRYVSIDGTSYPLSTNQVRWCLGLRPGGKPVPSKVSGHQMHSKLEEIEKKFGTLRESRKGRGRVVIELSSKFLDKLEGDFYDQSEEDFKIAFLIATLHLLLCPTLASTLASDLRPALTTFSNACEYDWAELVLERIFKSAMSFARTFFKHGFSRGVGGCSIFLAIFYLDRLRRPPICWDYYPRIAVWKSNLLEEAKNANKTPGNHGDFGVIGCINASYGNLHPLEALDKPPPMQAGRVETATSIASEVVRQLSKGLPTNINQDKEEIFSERPTTTRRRKGWGNRKVVTPSTPKEGDGEFGDGEYEVDEDRPDYDLNESTTSKENKKGVERPNDPNIKGKKDQLAPTRTKSRERRVLKTNAKYPSLKQPVVGSAKLQAKVLKWVVEKAKEDNATNVVVLSCGGQFCTANECATLIRNDGKVSNNYVNTVAHLYTESWITRFKWRTKPCMFESSLADTILGQKKTTKRCTFDTIVVVVKKSCSLLRSCFLDKGVRDISVVFVPVLDTLHSEDPTIKLTHWWCIAISLNSTQIFIIDSNATNVVDRHREVIQTIVKAVDSLFKDVDCTWEDGIMPNWSLNNIGLTQQEDSHNCGILMLLAIKRCAIRFESPLSLNGTTQTLRKLLLFDDLSNNGNECWQAIKSSL